MQLLMIYQIELGEVFKKELKIGEVRGPILKRLSQLALRSYDQNFSHSMADCSRNVVLPQKWGAEDLLERAFGVDWGFASRWPIEGH